MRSGRRLWAVLALAALLRVALALLRPLQVDEGYSLQVAGLPLANIFQILRTLDVHPPLFLLTLHGWLALHGSVVVLRVAFAVLGVVSVWLLYAIVRTWHGERAALGAALCAALMPSLLFYDVMLRMYAPFDTLALLTFFALSRLCARDDLSLQHRRALWVLWAFATAVMWYLLYLGLIVSAAQLLFVALLRRDALPRAVAGLGACTLAFFPQVPTFRSQLPHGGLAFPFYAQHQLQALGELAGQATIAVQTHGAAVWPVLAGVLAWCWLALVFAMSLRERSASLVVWLGAPAMLTLVYAAIAHKLLFEDRYYLLLAYALCAWTGLALDRLAVRSREIARPIALVAAAALALLACLYAFDPAFYTADWPAVGALIQARSQPRDLIVFEQGSPFFVLKRGNSLGRHPLLVVLRRSELDDNIALSRRFDRVFLVLFQYGPVDPDGRFFAALRLHRQVRQAWTFARALPAENAVVILFQR
ncbi:MAG: glycosyltransferase family 39 protein [Candidatus Eremiobacteraeota bacterium]|nr:glycosyltransferase family 39 protein [Candidatus Eremiobacteraeota bacterium]